MGCGPKAAAMEEEEQYQIKRIAALKKIPPERWDTFIDEVDGLLTAIHGNRGIMAIAYQTERLDDSLKQIRNLLE